MAASDGAIKAESGAPGSSMGSSKGGAPGGPRAVLCRPSCIYGFGPVRPSRQRAFPKICAASVQAALARDPPGSPDVKRRSALTKKVLKLTNVSANNGAAVVAVFTASLRSLLIAFD